jgi:hypothetical protein
MMRIEDELLDEPNVESQFDGRQIPHLAERLYRAQDDVRNTTLATLHRVSQGNGPS